MKKVLFILSLVLVFAACKEVVHSGQTSDSFTGKVVKYQQGSITYLVFINDGYKAGGLDVVNYTQDSLEYEFLHSPTKIAHGEDPCKTE
jgi:hypothetical protein